MTISCLVQRLCFKQAYTNQPNKTLILLQHLIIPPISGSSCRFSSQSCQSVCHCDFYPEVLILEGILSPPLPPEPSSSNTDIQPHCGCFSPPWVQHHQRRHIIWAEKPLKYSKQEIIGFDWVALFKRQKMQGDRRMNSGTRGYRGMRWMLIGAVVLTLRW